MGSQQDYFGLVSRQEKNNNNNPKFEGRHI